MVTMYEGEFGSRYSTRVRSRFLRGNEAPGSRIVRLSVGRGNGNYLMSYDGKLRRYWSVLERDQVVVLG
jgi:hypothetical protein